MTNLANNLVAAIVFAALGIVTFIVAFIVVDRLTPVRSLEGDHRGPELGAGDSDWLRRTRPRADNRVRNSLGVQGAAGKVQPLSTFHFALGT